MPIKLAETITKVITKTTKKKGVVILILLGFVLIGVVMYVLNKHKDIKPGELEKIQSQIAELEKKQAIQRGEIFDDTQESNKTDEIMFFSDINYNDPEPKHVLPGEEIVIFERKGDKDNLPGSEKDLWYYQSMQFKGEINYQLKILIGPRDDDYKLVNLSDYAETGIPNIIDWLTFNLPEEEKDVVNIETRHQIILHINKRFDEVSGTGIRDLNGILYTGLNYGPDKDNGDVNYRSPMKKNEPIQICRIESKYKRLPTGEYEYDNEENIKLRLYQKKEWNFKSMKIEQNTRVLLTVWEEDTSKEKNGKMGYNIDSLEYTIKYNVTNLIVWLENKDQEVFKYSPYNPVFNERIYFIELL